MVKSLIPISLISILFYGCQTDSDKKAELTQAERDSFAMKTYGKTFDEVVKDNVDKSLSDAMMDTVGLYNAPVKVTKATLFRREYSSFRDIRITFKNVSKKTISAIKFRWKGVDAFGDPADMGTSLVEGFGGGFTDETLRPNQIRTSEWGILSNNGKKVVLAWPTEVAFKDGSKWELRKK